MRSTTKAHARRILLAAAASAAALSLAACSSQGGDASSTSQASGGATDSFPVTVDHAYGSTTIDAEPTRVATVSWTNDDVALALGIVPVGLPKETYGDEDGDGYLPWVKDKLEQLGATGDKAPTFFDEADSIDFEGVASTEPDVILAAESGISQDDYDTLSDIAPTIAFPGTAWNTSWRDTVRTNAKALGRSAAGDQLISDTEATITTAVDKHPEIEGKSVALLYLNPADLSQITVYTTHDPRPQFLNDMGLTTPDSVSAISDTTDQFYTTFSSENADQLSDVDVIITFGDDSLLPTLQSNALLSKIPAIQRGSVAVIRDNSTLAAAVSPSVLSIPATIDDYASVIAEQAAKVQ